MSNYPGAPMGAPPAASPVNGTLILVLGILSFFLAGLILGPVAWIMGNNGLKTLDQYGDPLNQRGSVSAGRLCGMIATILWILGTIAYIIFIVVIVGAAATHPAPTTPVQ